MSQSRFALWLRTNPTITGALGGLFAVVSWGASFALIRAGTTQGLHAFDFVLLRYGTAGLMALPLLAFTWRDVLKIRLGRGIALALAAGPMFFLLGSSGFVYAPLAHGAIIQPSTVAIGGLLLGASLFGESLTARKLLGVAGILSSIALVGGSSFIAGNDKTWIGDLLFTGAGLLWLTFTLLVRQWQVDPIAGTIFVNVASALVVVPLYWLVADHERLVILPIGSLVSQIAIQGVMAGILATASFSLSVRQLGVSRAALFPAMVPTATVLIGIPIAGEFPTFVQVIGLTVATCGLALAIIRPAKNCGR